MDPIITHVESQASQILIPKVKFKVFMSNRDSSGREVRPTLLLAIVKLLIFGDNVATSPLLPICSLFERQIQLNVEIPFPRYLIDSIERKRVDDVHSTLQIEFLYSYLQNNEMKLNWHSASKEIKYSQKDWASLLSALGYPDYWVIEIAQPKIKSLDEVKKHLRKAAAQLSERNYDGCITNIRIAWKAFMPHLNTGWENIKKLIDEGSLGEPGYKSKSERVKEISDKILQFSNIGVHREAYQVFPEDALLSYYLTVTMISYLSKWIQKQQ